MKKKDAYTLMDQLLTLEYDLDSMSRLSAMLLHAQQEHPSDPISHLLHCHAIWINHIQHKLRDSINLLDEAILS